MNNFEHIQHMSVDEFADWLDKNGQFDDSPWMNWFNQNYCKNCKPIMCHYPETPEREFLCSWCELHDNRCKYFPDLEKSPGNKEIIKMWLEKPVNSP